MFAAIFALIISLGSLVAVAVSVGIPYWTKTQIFRRTIGIFGTTALGLWQSCTYIGELKLCVSHDLMKRFDWWAAVCGLEIAGLAFGALGTILSVVALCVKRTSRYQIAAALSSIVAAACVGAGFITFSVHLQERLENAHAGYYLNIVGCVGLAVNGFILLCVRRRTKQHSHQTSHAKDQQTGMPGEKTASPIQQTVYIMNPSKK